MSMERQTVRLLEGPLHGQIRHVHPTRSRFTERIQTGVKQQEYGGVTVDVPQIDAVSYKRVSDEVFVFCATQTAMGSPNPDFYKEEPEMSETATPDPQPDPLAPAQPVPPVQEPDQPAEPDQDDDNDAESVKTTETTTETTEEEVEF